MQTNTESSRVGAGIGRGMRYISVDSPLGPLLLTSDGTALTGLYMAEIGHSGHVGGSLSPWGIRDAPGVYRQEDDARPFGEARIQLAAYFEGRLTEFDLPLAMAGTAFQKMVWQALLAIPYGTTITYGELARRVGNPNGSRAVGLANGRNPISIIVPCHRVIGSNGKLIGYGGGLPRKAALLDFEFSVALGGPHPFPRVADIEGPGTPVAPLS